MTSPTSTPLEAVARHRGLIALLLAAAAIRFSGIGAWWLNPDEGIYYSILTRAGFSDFWAEVTANAHPPLYYLALRAIGSLTWDVTVLRLFSAGWGVAAVWGAWAVGRELARPRLDQGTAGRDDGGLAGRAEVAGLLAGLILAVAPGAVELSQVMRPYMLQSALLLWAWLCFLRYEDEQRVRDLVLHAALLSAAVLVHYSSALALGAFACTTVFRGARAGFGTAAWRRLAAAQLVPIALVGVLYLTHLRSLAESALADEALDGWLSFYMVSSAADVWWSFLGFQHHLAAAWLRAPVALFTLLAIAVALRARADRVWVPLAAGLGVAVAAAALGAYPFGSTRHSTWLLTFVVPALGWLGAVALDAPFRGRHRARLVVPAVLVVFGGPLGDLLGTARAPWAPTDQVLARQDLGRVIAVLDPAAAPETMLMSSQTFYLLVPFWAVEREGAVFAPDSSTFHFAYGARRVVVSRAWDFTLDEGPDDLVAWLDATSRGFPTLGLAGRDRATLLVGGWRPALVDRLRARASRGPGWGVRSERSVPGLHAFELVPSELLASGR